MNDNLHDELHRSLHRQADGIHGAPISFEAVRGTAGRIRNRRRAMVAGTVLAAGAAIVAPTALLAGLGDGEGDGERPPVVDTPGVTETPTPQPATGLDIRGLEQGAASSVPVVEGTMLLTHSSDSPDLGVELQEFVQLGEYVVGKGRGAGGADATIYVLHPMTGEVLLEEPAHHTSLVVGATGSAVAWMDAQGRPKIWEKGATEPIVLQGTGSGTNHQAVAMTGERCGEDAAPGCAVFFTQEHGRGGARSYVADTLGNVDVATNTIRSLADVTTVPEGGNLHVGITEVRDDGTTCSALVGPHSDSATWTTCDHRPQEFSPDGSRIAAVQSYGDGLGDSEVAILDAADGDVLVSLDNRRSHAFVRQVVWEDDEHLLATVFQEGRWAIVRIGVDGTMELVDPPRPGEDIEPPYYLMTQP